MTSDLSSVERLYATLKKRETPETVAGLIRGALPDRELGSLKRPLVAVVNASKKTMYGWSSMPVEFAQPVGASRQVGKARELVAAFLQKTLPQGHDAEALDAVIEALDLLIGKARGANNIQGDRLGRDVRIARLGVSRRRYNKLFRLAARLERKAARLREAEARLDLTLVSKAALAPRLALEDLGGHLPTAAFIAYYAARMKLRSEFTISGQQRPFDTLSASLLKRCEKDPNTRWWAVAHVFPRADVLARLSEEQRGRLLGSWFDILQITAERLSLVANESLIDVETMVVKRGDDSSTWNLLAGAWNRSRDHWIALIEAMGAQRLFDLMLPGKVMRLIAGDVAAWHLSLGRPVHPDTLVWRELPKPWSVVQGDATCTRTDIERTCAKHGVHPVKSGWTAARSRTEVAGFRPTPELVHGVAVNNPFLAAALRGMNVYSGKPLKTASLGLIDMRQRSTRMRRRSVAQLEELSALTRVDAGSSPARVDTPKLH